MIRLLSHAEQLADHLREELLRGRWQGVMPGVAKLEAELGVNHTTIAQALLLLEGEKFLVSKGNRQPRRIVLPKGAGPSGTKVGLFLFEPADLLVPCVVELRHRLIEEGHAVSIPPRTLTELEMDVKKIARAVRAHQMDGWVVLGASGQVLEWFSKQSTPFIAFAGEYPEGVSFAAVAPGKENAITNAVRRLVRLGHRRIVLLTGSGVRPYSFLSEMEALGVPVSDYNLPTMKRSPDGLRRCLDALFAVTPPTALLIDEPAVFLAAQHHLAQRGIFAPRQVSLVCMDDDPAFHWQRPKVARIRWEAEPIIARILKWAFHVSRGQNDTKRTYTKSVFIDGETIGPVPR